MEGQTQAQDQVQVPTAGIISKYSACHLEFLWWLAYGYTVNAAADCMLCGAGLTSTVEFRGL